MPLTPATITVVGAANIGYQNLLSSSDDPELLTPDTWQRWRPVGADNATVSMASAQVCDYIGIAAHTLSGIAVTVETSATSGGALTTRYSATPTDNRPIIIDLADLSIFDVKITVGGACEVGVIYAGNLLEMERPIYGGHSPLLLNKATEYQSNMSDSGQFLGRQIIRKGAQAPFVWRNLTADWVRSDFEPFILAAQTRPFFMQWRPDIYATEIAFCHTEKDITAVNQGGGTDLMTVTANIRAHSDI